MNNNAINALPLATRQQLAVLQVLARLECTAPTDWDHPMILVAYIARIYAGDEAIINFLTADVDYDALGCQYGFTDAFNGILELAEEQA